jgi:replicative DNA helicase
VNIAENAALGSNKSAAIFSMEMSAESLTLRMISSLGRINQSNLRSGRLQEDDWPRIDSAMTQLSNAKIFVDETPGLSPTEIRARARRLKRERGLDLIVVDYLQLMQVAGTKENRATEISEISRSLKALAKELKLPIIALSQLNRGVEQRVEKKPVMSDLRECVTGDTLVCLADGGRVPIRDLVGHTPLVWAMDEDRTIVKARSDWVWCKGVRPVFRVLLEGGRALCATAQHRVFTVHGWKTVAELGVGSRLAVARRCAPVAPALWSDDACAWALADGLAQASAAPADLSWERVVAVAFDGEQEVFDLTVPGPASWLADGIVSHNSGALEQDADLILLIYREEFYDPNTTRKGIADIIIAKQRNGPTGDVQLTFLGQYTKFENYAPESYAEGVFR